MKIYIVERNRETAECIKKIFSRQDNITIINESFVRFMQCAEIDCVVSPANSFGLMDGGFDAAITEFFGEELQQKVQRKIIDEYGGHQTLGTALTIDATPTCKLIHVPTMCVPSMIKDPFIIYECMRSALFEAEKQGCKDVVLPVFGGLTGGVCIDVCAKMMYLGYLHFKKPNTTISWEIACSIADEFEDLGISLIS